MTKEEQRIAIAEKCVWVKGQMQCSQPGCTLDHTGYIKNRNFRFENELPNYPEDLNAMHEAEEIMGEATWAKYLLILGNLKGNHPWYNSEYVCMCHATAPQRAEAFCRVFWPERFEKGTK